MGEICQRCGLPRDICACEILAKEEEKIRIFFIKRRYGKAMTIVKGLSKDIDSKKLLKGLKTKLACGGTVKNGEIELQGRHVEKVKQFLIKEGFKEDQIEI